MSTAKSCFNGMVVSPQHLASQAGLSVLREGGNALEAVVATAAALGVVYPHMTGLGGDAFWTIYNPEGFGAGFPDNVLCLDACGKSGQAVTPEALALAGHKAVPRRGPWAAITVPGAVSGWQAALDLARAWGGKALPLPRLLEEAVFYAANGFAVSRGQHEFCVEAAGELLELPDFAAQFMPGGKAPEQGSRLAQPALAETLRRLGREGLDSFYRGKLAARIGTELSRAGSPLTSADFAGQRAEVKVPLRADLSCARVFNQPPPSQGLASLIILALYDRLGPKADGFAQVHNIVEATKPACALRDARISDPARMGFDPRQALEAAFLDSLAGRINADKAGPWLAGPDAGDTVWLGAIDARGRAVSCIQSIFFDFGSGVFLPQSGLIMQNRGTSFNLEPGHVNRLAPAKKPLHTLNTPLALFHDGRVMPFGSMGGDGQPQVQAALFSRYAWLGYGLQDAVSAPRWVLGRHWGAASSSLKLESRFDPAIIAALERAGHETEIVRPYCDLMGHAGALVRHPDGLIEGASDPRSDGAAAGW